VRLPDGVRKRVPGPEKHYFGKLVHRIVRLRKVNCSDLSGKETAMMLCAMVAKMV